MENELTNSESDWFDSLTGSSDWNIFYGGIYNDVSFPGEVDLFKGLLLHPRCDLEVRKTGEHPKVRIVSFLPLIPVDVFCARYAVEKALFHPERNIDTIRKAVAEHLSSVAKGSVERFALLPASARFEIPSCVVDFEKPGSHPLEAVLKLHAICELCSPYNSLVQNDFARFYDRLGMPSLPDESVRAHACRAVDDLQALSAIHYPSASARSGR